jgi:Mn-dependent DtxR family transcriptional regulator
MIIGSDFNSKAKEILKMMFEMSEGEEGLRVEVKALCKGLKIDKTEAKNLFEYLESKGCIKIETMGGPYLYGDVSLTKKGVVKSQK